MPGIAEQLKLWAKGRGNPSKKDEEEEKKKKEATENGGRPAGSSDPNKDDEVPMPLPPFGKDSKPKPDPKKEVEDRDNKDLAEWAKKAKQTRKFPQFKKGE